MIFLCKRKHVESLTTSGGRKHLNDGTRGPARVRYSCFYRVRHKNECDGQAGYGKNKLDDIVDELIRVKFMQIKAKPKSEIVALKTAAEKDILKSQISRVNIQISKKKKEIEDYKKEAIKVIRGESKFSAELLEELIDTSDSELSGLSCKLLELQSKLDDTIKATNQVEEEYEQIMTWADLYDNCSIRAKKMIISQLISSIHVYKDYSLDVKFNISFEQFLEKQI